MMPLAMTIERFGVGNLRPDYRPPERLGPELVRVAVKAVSLNYRDVLVVRGTYAPGLSVPLIPCSDGAGVVLEVGADVPHLKSGDRVCTHMVPDWQDGPLEPRMRSTTLGGPAQGVLCEERVLPSSAVLRIPETLSFEEAACLPVAGLTAWCGLVRSAEIGPGSRVLLLGTGGISLMALQIAKRLGARVAVTSSSDAKLARAQALGADFTANYRRDQWADMVREWSGGGVDAVLEVGGPGTLEQSMKATRDGGCVVLLGVLAPRGRPADLADIFLRQIRVQGLFVGSRAELGRYLAFVTSNDIHPVIDRVFEGLTAARHAFAHLLTGRHLGKVVIGVST
jgi:NADPH:quinone reductase-like Zn-dependent oxidoreductase